MLKKSDEQHKFLIHPKEVMYVLKEDMIVLKTLLLEPYLSENLLIVSTNSPRFCTIVNSGQNVVVDIY